MNIFTLKNLKLIHLFNIIDLKRWNFMIYCYNMNGYDFNYNNLIDISNYFHDENLSHNIPDDIYNNTKPLKLDLNNHNLSFIPLEITFLKNLCVLNLSCNSITNFYELPNSIKSIFLNRNKIKSLPEHFFNLINIETLELKHNLLSELPK